MKPVIAITMLGLVGVVVVGAAMIGNPPEKPVTEKLAPSPTPENDGFPPLSPTGPYPTAVVDSTEHDFGTMEMGTTNEHTFTVRNEGDAPLVIEKGPVTCKCTLSETGGDAIPPGESANVKLEWTPAGAQPMFRQTAEIRTNDPENRTITLAIVGVVDEVLRVDPDADWDVGRIDDDETFRVSGTIVSRVLDKFSVTSIETSAPFLTAKAEPLTEEELADPAVRAKCGYRIRVSLSADVPIGTVRESLTVTTDARGGKEERITLRGYRTGPFRLLPSAGTSFHPEAMLIDFGSVDVAKGAKASLFAMVKGLGDEELEISNVKTDPTFLRVAVEPVNVGGGKSEGEKPVTDKSKSKRYRLRFEIPPGSAPVTRQKTDPATVEFDTNHPEAKSLKFRINFVGR